MPYTTGKESTDCKQMLKTGLKIIQWTINEGRLKLLQILFYC